MVYSTNWSGYMNLASNTYNPTYVHARWIVPKSTCVADANPEDTVLWVGLDGWGSNTVEQDGTEVYCAGTTPYYYAWWEMYPTNYVTDVFPVAPGDRIDASVKFVGGLYAIRLSDMTSKKSFAYNEACGSGLTCSNASAEWIAESPGFSSGLADLADYHAWKPWLMTVSVNGGTKTGPENYPYTPVTMITESNNKVRASVSPNLGGKPSSIAFTDTFVYAYTS